MSTQRLNTMHLFPICDITMTMSSNERLTIRIDRGNRPAITLNAATSNVQIYVPLDTSVNYQPVTQDVGNGFTVKLQRMQQQYKIVMQHIHEKKPEFAVFASNLVHEKEIKTTVREVNTKIPDLTIAGSNLEVSGILKGHNLTFESTVGTMHVYAKITCTGSLSVHSQNIVISTEALLSTDVFKAICRKLQNDGRIFPVEESQEPMSVELSCNLVHIGVDGSIGASKERERKKQIVAENLKLSIAGDLANYGKIIAKERIDLLVQGNQMSLSDGSLDSAGRGYNALKKLRKVGEGSPHSCAPSSSSMHSAIQNQNTGTVANMIEKGIDLNDTVGRTTKSKKVTLKQSAITEYKEAREKSNLNSVRERITLINALFVAHEWRRGSIQASSIAAVIARNCEDVAQFSAKNLKLKVSGITICEKDSIWNSTWVELECKQHVYFHGQTKTRTMILHTDANVFTTNEAILSCELFGRIACVKFDCEGMWCAGESLVIETIGNIVFKEGSYMESENLELECRGACEVDGTWQLTSGWAHVLGMLTVQPNAKLFIEESADISALGLHFSGFCHVTDKMDLILQDSAHFFGSSRLEAHVVRLTCKGFCTMGGSIAVGDLSVYVRNELITTCTGKVMVLSSADVITGCFRNDSLWQVEKNLKMITGSIEQSEDGTIFVKYSMEIVIHEECQEFFGGKLVSSEIILKSLKSCIFDGLIRCNEMQISLPYVGQSMVTLKGQADIVAGSLTVNGNLSVFEENIREPVLAGLIVACNLTAAAILAPFASVHIAENAVVRLNGIESYKTDEFNVLLNCGGLYTEKESVVLSMAAENNEKRIKCEAVICATTFYHRGQIRFSGQEVNILAPVFVHEGRLSNVDNKQNHVKSLFIHIGELLLNNGILACDFLEIVGDGMLENTNRIYAVESMDIKLRNFNNDDGLIESKNSMKLLAVSKEWTKLGGSIKAKKNVDLCANRLNVAIRNVQNLSVDKRLVFSAKTDLLISSDVVDESKELSVGCAAQKSVAVDCQMQVDRLEVLLGVDSDPKLPATFAVYQNASILANTILVTSKSEHVQVLFDGNVNCNRLRFAGSVKSVTIVGSGNLESVYMMLPSASVSFEMYAVVRVDELQCHSFDVFNENILRLESCEGEDTTTIVTEDLNIEGTIFLEKKLFIKSREGVVRLSGNVLGSSPKSEIACEATKMVVKGQLGNFKFVELFARESISLQNEKIRHAEKVCIECAELSIYNVEMESCRNVSLNCDSLTASGHIQGEHDTTVTINSTNIHSKLDLFNLERFSVFCKRSTTLKGKYEHVQQIDVDSKWINMSCDVEHARSIKLTAWAITGNNQMCANDIKITALSVFVNNSSLLAASHCQIIATFILSLTRMSVISGDHISMYSLCLCTRNDVSNVVGVNYLWLNFDPMTRTMGATNSEMNSWKTTIALLRDRWMTTSIDADEILIGLKYISDLQEIKIPLNTENQVYEGLVEICDRFNSTPISLFNYGEFINVIQMARGLLQVVQDVSNGKKEKKRRSDGSLYEALVQFKHGKYSKETNDSSDTDIGYVSRSSSEDLNTKASRPRSPLVCDHSPSFFEISHLENIEDRVSKAEEELENELKLDHVAYAIKEKEELAEFEELEDEIEMAEEGIVRTDFVICKEKSIYLAKLKEKVRTVSAPRPVVNIPIQRMPSSNDLVMKKLQVKQAISNLDLRSFGSQSSLASLDFGTVPDFGSPLQFSKPSSFQRSKIPLGSFRSPKKPMSRVGTPTMYSSTLSRFNDMLDGILNPGTSYNASFCYNVSRGRLVTIECDYPLFYYLESVLYRSVFGCFFHLVEVLLLGALWFCNIWIQRDFTEAFMSSVAVPLTISTVMKIATFVWDMLFPKDIEKSWLIDMAYATSVTTAQMTLVQGLPFLLFMAMKMGTCRRQSYGLCTWIPYVLILVLSFPLSAIFNMFYKPTYAAPSLVAILALIIIALVFMFVFIGMSCMTFACCSKKKLAMDMLDPVIYDARSRLGWSMLYSICAPLSVYPCFYCFVSLAFFLDMTNDYAILQNEMATRVWNFFFGPTVLIFTFIILPSYRDTIMCGCKYRRFQRKIQMSMLAAPTAQGVTQQIRIAEPEKLPVISMQPQKEKVVLEPIFVTTSSADGKKRPPKQAYPVQMGI
ncbi:unnamed protein product [Caenorhabditis sp. 36 PRJEB53466]|nr:unnamed protein product [Caenorhabditis sp. 36 PRJEB53466]